MATADEDDIGLERRAAAIDAYDQAWNGETPHPNEATGAELPADDASQVQRLKVVIDLLHAAFDMRPAAEGAGADIRRLGRFEICSVLGRGGFGIVFRAYDTVVRREIALKVPTDTVFFDPEARQRFLREAEAAGRLDHPNIVRVLEAGEADGSLYVAFELVDGDSLADWLGARTQPLAPRLAAEWVQKLAEAVAHAHERDVLHRDIKPANILLAPGGSGELPFIPKLTDFGLARITDCPQERTRTGAVLGTARYMSPEQAIGAPQSIGPATDVYSLGVVLYELLTGKAPFAETTDPFLMAKVLEEPPTSPRQIRRNLPRDLETICLKCLEKDATARYSLAKDLAEDLRRFLAGEPILARRTALPARLGKWVKRHRLASVTAMMVLLSVLIVAGAIARSIRDGTESVALKRELVHHRYFENLRLAFESLKSGDAPTAAWFLSACVPAAGAEDFRGFEWSWLQSLSSGRSVEGVACKELVGHRGPVYFIAFSRDDRRIATAGADCTVRLWESATGKLIRSLPGHLQGACWASFSPDGGLLATAGDDRTVRIWNTTTGEEVNHLLGHDAGVIVAQFSPNGTTLASGDDKGIVILWNAKTGQRIASTTATPGNRVEAITFSSDGSRLVAAGNKTIHFWQTDGLRLLHSTTRAVAVAAVTFSRDGRFLVGAGWNEIFVLDGQSGQQLHSFAASDHHSQSVALSPDGSLLYSIGRDGTLWHWAVPRRIGGIAWRFPTRCWSIASSHSGWTIAVGDNTGVVRLLRAADAPIFQVPGAPPNGNTFSLIGDHRVACANRTSSLAPTELRVWDLESFGDGLIHSERNEGGMGLAVSPSQDRYVLGVRLYKDHNEFCLLVKDARSNATLRRIPAGNLGPVINRFSPDGKWLASTMGDGGVPVWNLRLWDFENGAERETISGAPGGTFFTLAASPTAPIIATSSQKEVWIHEFADPRRKHLIGQFNERVIGVDFSLDGSRLFAWTGNECKKWETSGFQPITSFSPGANIFVPSRNRDVLLTMEGVNKVAFRRADTGAEILSFTGAPILNGYAEWSRDGRRLLIGSTAASEDHASSILILHTPPGSSP